MITVKKYKCTHLFRTEWNKHLKEQQYESELADCICVYIFGLLIYKHLKSIE